MSLTALILARIQFAFALGYHIIFPTLSIGLALYLALLRTREHRSGDPRYRQQFDYWLKFFALTFGMGVVSGVVLSYAIGTTFGRFSELAGAVVGPLMSYEVMTAFFLEAGFLGVMLFGRERVGAGVHLFSTWMVAVGTVLSAFWILAANSWMHTPAGYAVVDGHIRPTDWVAAIFNPSFPYRFAHMVMASLLTTGFVIAAVAAWYLLRGEHTVFAQRTLRNAILGVAVAAPLQIFIGDLHGLNTFEHQPVKVAAMEGHWQTGTRVPLLLFAWPDQAAEMNHYEIALPGIASLLLTHDIDGEVTGLDAVAPADRPLVWPVFFAFRVMLACGVLMLVLAWTGLVLLWRRRLDSSRRYLKVLSFTAPLGFIAIIAGWITTEMGRQPWTVQGLIRTSEAVSNVSAGKLVFTLATFAVVYLVLFTAFIWAFRLLMNKGPVATAREPIMGGQH